MTPPPAPAQAASTTDTRMLKAMSHPLRMQILTRLDGKVASPRELTARLDATLGAVSYHVRVLRDLGLIELVKTRQRRGATEHYYRGLARPMLGDDAVAMLPAGVRRSLAGAVVHDIVSDVSAALRSGAFEARNDAHVIRLPLVLDEKGWARASALLAEALDSLLHEQADASARLVAADADGLNAEAVILFFPTAVPLS